MVCYRVMLLILYGLLSVIVPKMAKELVISWINHGLKDLSVSRPSSRVPWGIPTPSNDNQTVSDSCLLNLVNTLLRYTCGLMPSVITSLLPNTSKWIIIPYGHISYTWWARIS